MITEKLDIKKISSWTGIFLLALTNIKREKIKSGLVLITISLATLLFLTALSSYRSFRKPIVTMLSEQNASHALINFDVRLHSMDEIVNYWKKHDKVESLTPLLPYVIIDNRPRSGNKELGTNLILTERPLQKMTQDILTFQKGKRKEKSKKHPASGEIWIATSTAKSADLKIGNILEISTNQGIKNFKISGIVVDPQFSSGFIQPERAWVAPGELARLFSPSVLNNYTLGIRLRDPKYLDEAWNNFNQFLNNNFTGSYTSFDDIINSYSYSVNLLSMITMIFGVVSLFVAMFIIFSTINGQILANYRVFGILKAIGYTPSNITYIFQIQFLLITCIALPIGIIGAFVVTKILLGLMLSTVGGSRISIDFIVPLFYTVFIFFTAVLIASGYSGRKAGKIKPAFAVRFGAPEKKLFYSDIIHIRLAKYLPITFLIGFKNLLSEGLREIYDLITVSITAFIILFSVNVFNSLDKMDENMPFWGLDNSDVTINRSSGLFGIRYETLKAYLEKYPGVIIAGANSSIEISVPGNKTTPIRKFFGQVVDGNMDTFGFINLVGKNPSKSDEISLGVKLAEQYNLKLGDEIKIQVQGTTQAFKVSGIFQSTNMGGYTFRLTLGGVRLSDPHFEPQVLTVSLNKSTDRNKFMQTLESGFGQAISVETREKLVEAQLKSVTSNLGIVLMFLCLIFLLVTFLIIFNSTIMKITESRRFYGIYKAIGYTQNQIRLIIVFKSIILGLISVMLGYILYFTLTQKIMNLLMTQMGMVNFPLIITLFGSLLMPFIIIAVCAISAWLPSNRIIKIKPRELILE